VEDGRETGKATDRVPRRPADKVGRDDGRLLGLARDVARHERQAQRRAGPEREHDVVRDQQADAPALGGVVDRHEDDGAGDASAGSPPVMSVQVLLEFLVSRLLLSCMPSR